MTTAVCLFSFEFYKKIGHGVADSFTDRASDRFGNGKSTSDRNDFWPKTDERNPMPAFDCRHSRHWPWPDIEKPFISALCALIHD